MTQPRLLHVATVPMTLRFLAGQLRYMRNAGMDTHVASAPGPSAGNIAELLDCEHHHVPFARSISPVQDALALGAMLRLLRRLRPDIVHAHTPKAGLIATVAARTAGVPVRIYHVHGLPLSTAQGMTARLLGASERTSCRAATHVMAVSSSVASELAALGLASRNRVTVLGSGSINGVDTTHFDPSLYAAARTRIRASIGAADDDTVLGFVGRLVRDKGVHELYHAWRRLRERHPQARLLIVGFFEERDAVSEEVRAGLMGDERVHITGPQWDTAPYYAAMDAFALPSYREGLPVSALEAAAMQLPVVITRATGCVEAVEEGETAIVVPVGDVCALTNALVRYIDAPSLRSEHGAAGRARVQKLFDPATIWEQQLAFYCAALSHTRARLASVGEPGQQFIA